MTQDPDNSVGAEGLREMVVTVLSELDEMANRASVPMELWDRFSNNVIGLCVEAGALALLSTSEAWKPPEGFVVAGWQYRRPQEYLDRHPSASEWVYALQVTEKGAREASYGGFKGRPLNIVRPLFAAPDQPSHGGGWRTDIALIPPDGSWFQAYRPDAGVFPATYRHPDHEDGGWDDTQEPVIFDVSGDDLTSDPPTMWRPMDAPPTHTQEG